MDGLIEICLKIDNKNAFEYQSPVVPRKGDIMDLDSDGVVGKFKVVNIEHSVFKVGREDDNDIRSYVNVNLKESPTYSHTVIQLRIKGHNDILTEYKSEHIPKIGESFDMNLNLSNDVETDMLKIIDITQKDSIFEDKNEKTLISYVTLKLEDLLKPEEL